MPQRQGNSKSKLVKAIMVAAVVIAGILIWNTNREPPGDTLITVKPVPPPVSTPGDEIVVVKGPIEQMPEIDYSELDKVNKLTTMMNLRKQDLGIDKSLDMVVNSNESFKVGKTTVSMREILEKSLLKRNMVFEEKISESGEVLPETTDKYGIHVVKKGENLWNIHFNIIQEYYRAKGIKVSKNADEPRNHGYSSGIGRLLKFSEKIVTIYNLLEKKVTPDINLLEPLSKVVVYNMKEVFSLLEEINYDNVDTIQFDGETIWIPAQQPDKKGN